MEIFSFTYFFFLFFSNISVESLQLPLTRIYSHSHRHMHVHEQTLMRKFTLQLFFSILFSSPLQSFIIFFTKWIFRHFKLFFQASEFSLNKLLIFIEIFYRDQFHLNMKLFQFFLFLFEHLWLSFLQNPFSLIWKTCISLHIWRWHHF